MFFPNVFFSKLVPRYAAADESMKRAVVTQGIVFVGMFVFAIIIGIISDEIASKVEEVKTGNSKVVETDHTASFFEVYSCMHARTAQRERFRL